MVASESFTALLEPIIALETYYIAHTTQMPLMITVQSFHPQSCASQSISNK